MRLTLRAGQFQQMIGDAHAGIACSDDDDVALGREIRGRAMFVQRVRIRPPEGTSGVVHGQEGGQRAVSAHDGRFSAWIYCMAIWRPFFLFFPFQQYLFWMSSVYREI